MLGFRRIDIVVIDVGSDEGGEIGAEAQRPPVAVEAGLIQLAGVGNDHHEVVRLQVIDPLEVPKGGMAESHLGVVLHLVVAIQIEGAGNPAYALGSILNEVGSGVEDAVAVIDPHRYRVPLLGGCQVYAECGERIEGVFEAGWVYLLEADPDAANFVGTRRLGRWNAALEVDGKHRKLLLLGHDFARFEAGGETLESGWKEVKPRPDADAGEHDIPDGILLGGGRIETRLRDAKGVHRQERAGGGRVVHG